MELIGYSLLLKGAPQSTQLFVISAPVQVRACDHIDGVSNMMASPQCMGYKPQAKLTASLCLPEKQDVLKDVKRAVKAIKAKGVYVATDNDPMLNDLSKHLKSLKVRVHCGP